MSCPLDGIPWNSYLFLCFPVTVAGNSWKNQMSSNFVFSSWKVGGRKQGYPSRPRRGRDGVYPCLRPPFFNEKTQNYANLVFSTVSRNVTGKQRNRCLFLTFSTFWPQPPPPLAPPPPGAPFFRTRNYITAEIQLLFIQATIAQWYSIGEGSLQSRVQSPAGPNKFFVFIFFILFTFFTVFIL